MSKSQWATLVLTVVCALGLAAVVPAQEREREYKAPPEPTLPTQRAPQALSAVNVGYLAPKGSFDLKGDLVHYLDESSNFRVAKANKYADDANFWYFQEVTYPQWWWAFAKNPDGAGHYAIWWRPGANPWRVFDSGMMRPRVGD